MNIAISLDALIMSLSERDEKLVSLLLWLYSIDRNCAPIIFIILEIYNIRGKELEILWEDCCKSNLKTFCHTINDFWAKKYTEAEIHDRINADPPLPFAL